MKLKLRRLPGENCRDTRRKNAKTSTKKLQRSPDWGVFTSITTKLIFLFCDIKNCSYCFPVSGSSYNPHFLFEKVCIKSGPAKTIRTIDENLFADYLELIRRIVDICNLLNLCLRRCIKKKYYCHF